MRVPGWTGDGAHMPALRYFCGDMLAIGRCLVYNFSNGKDLGTRRHRYLTEQRHTLPASNVARQHSTKF